MKMKTLWLNREIYTEASVRKALEAYADYSDIAVVSLENNWQLIFHNSRYGDELTAKEFVNYLIDAVHAEGKRLV